MAPPTLFEESPPVVRGRWQAFVCSLLLHGAAVPGLLFLSTAIDWSTPATPRYKVLMLPVPKPQEHIVWYDFRQATPEVTPEKRFGPGKTPQGQKDSRTLIAQSPKPDSTRQVIWQPKPKPLPADVKAPNLIAAPKAPPRQFVMPDAPKRPVPAVGALAAAPAVTLNQDHPQLELFSASPKVPLRQFVAPAASSKGTGPAGASPAITDAPLVAAPNGSVNGVETVIVGLNPADRLSAPLPEGSRSGQFARAPTAGVPSSGAGTGDGVRVPGLMAHGTPGRPPDSDPGAAAGGSKPAVERRVIKETTFPALNRTMSAPLRPSSRVIPATVESQFSNRNVYTMVIPAVGLPEYGGEWVLWFAEQQPAASVAPRMSAPVPARKFSSYDPAGTRDLPASATVQLAATIDNSGHVSGVRVLRSPAIEPVRRKAAEELATWEFQPAMRNGEPIAVDVVVEIPFEFASASQQPAH